MGFIAKVTVLCFLASYLVAFVMELLRLLGRSTLSRFVMIGFGIAGLTAHTMYLYARSRETHLPPLLSSTHDWMLVLAWLLVLIYLFLTTFDRDLALGVFILPLVLVLIGATYFMSQSPNELLNAQRGWKMLHAAFLVFGMGGVALGFVSGVMYVAQHRRLKTRHGSQSGWKMPSLERLAQFNRWSVMASFPLLTLGMLTGVLLGVMSQRAAHPVSFADPVVIASAMTWLLLFGLFTWLLRHRRPSGRHVAWLTIFAFGFLMLTLVGLQVLTGSHVMHIETWHTRLQTPYGSLLPEGVCG